jgi:4-alpha-glucanotransferase
VIAEDLGTITPAVHALRRAAGLPGMRVLQFGFAADARDLNLPHNLPEDCAVYTGTHDNDTSLGWFAGAVAMSATSRAPISRPTATRSAGTSSTRHRCRARVTPSIPCRMCWAWAAKRA